MLKKHYNPKRFELLRVSIFAPEIRNLKSLVVIMCCGEHLNQALWGRFVCGQNNVKIQNKLLNTGDLVFKKACSIAETMEG
mgnify:FL=1